MERIIKTCRIFFIFVFVLIGMVACVRSTKDQVDEVETVEEELPIPTLAYGIPVDSFLIETGKVKSNQYLSQILNAKGVSMGDIDRIAKNSKTLFDVRRIQSGKNYSFFLTPDSMQQPKYFIYEDSPVEYFVYELFDSLKVYRGEKDIETRQRIAEGTIESSLWNTMVDNGLDPMLALELNDIYQWTIDFFAVQKGDRFRVVFDERYVDSTYVGIGDIYAAEFDSYNEPVYAFRFAQNDSVGYYDENGQNLQKQFLKAPLKFSRISSRFSNGRMHPVLRIVRAHHGVDYAAPKGTPVMSIGDGIVTAKAYQANGGGNYVKIKHNSVYSTTYMHLSGYPKGIAPGVRVRQGQVVGYVGSTGLATGPHLDFRVYKNGTAVDPLKIKSPPADPVKPENMLRYVAWKDSLLNELNRISLDSEMIANIQ